MTKYLSEKMSDGMSANSVHCGEDMVDSIVWEEQGWGHMVVPIRIMGEKRVAGLWQNYKPLKIRT